MKRFADNLFGSMPPFFLDWRRVHVTLSTCANEPLSQDFEINLVPNEPLQQLETNATFKGVLTYYKTLSGT